MADDPRFHIGMLIKEEVQSVGPRVHQRFQPGRTARVLRAERVGTDEKLHAKVLIDRRFAFGLRQPPHRVDVVRLDSIEIVLGLRVDHAEDGVGVGLAEDMGNAPIVADDGDGARLALPAGERRRRGPGAGCGSQKKKKSAETFHTNPWFKTVAEFQSQI